VSAELVNLRKARKAKQRVEEDLRAAANRLRFGRSRDAREAEAAAGERDARALDGKKLER
jgi:hypothetical protein